MTETFGIARSTLYRWLEQIQGKTENPGRHAWNKTPQELAWLVWRIAGDNIQWGRTRIANQLKILGLFLSASTVRNILDRPRPTTGVVSRAISGLILVRVQG